MTESFSGATTGTRFASVWDAPPPGLRDADKSTREPLAGAGGTCTPANPENATKAVYWAIPMALNNWTNHDENATCALCMEVVSLSNE